MQAGSLSGIVVLDLTRVLAGPFCTMILRDLGARIIKVEQLGKGDDSRAFGPFIDNESAYSCALNRGKESIALDLKDAKDRKIFEKLILKADIMVENFRPGVMDKLGYSWSHIQEMNPKLIYAVISGFGQSGPYAMRAAYDLIAQAMSGLMSITGQPGNPPTKAGIELGDITAGLYAAIGICAALYGRNQTGKGLRIGASMLDCLVGMMVGAIGTYSAEHTPIQPSGNRHRQVAPFDTFDTKDRQIVICTANDKLFAKLCDVLEHPEWAQNANFQTNALRVQNIDPLTKLMQEKLITMPSEYWLQKFLDAGIPAGPVNSLSEAMTEPQLAYRNMIAQFEDNHMRHYRFPGNPIKFSAYPDTNQYPRGPNIDEHRKSILDWLNEKS